ncbi:unnamed protein product [Microthlaspi erraticum]|uniref:Uncharacterized protein n=1 Tax=Microthlaspi erraticum TaxID=1685480 RepID=A0A6D2J5U5_9BRAS|nr:unnamed protein product [Microthlaspi erraticum]
MESKQAMTAKQKTMKRNVPETVKQEPTSQHVQQEYFQDAQLPDDEINIDEIGRRFNIDVNTKSEENFEEPEEEYECPDDHYGCCDKHILQFEMDH